MKKYVLMVLLGGGVTHLWAQDASDPVRFRVELKPIGGITSSDLDGLGVRYDTGFISYSETLDGYSSYMGTVQAGLEINSKPCYFDFLAGGGFSANGGFAGGVLTGDVGCRFKLNESGTVTLGPFFGVIVPTDTDWNVLTDGDEGTIDLNGSAGWQGGLKFTGGWKHIDLLLQLGYAQYGYEFSTDNPSAWDIGRDGGWENYATANKEVDMDGFFGQFGVSAQF